MKLKKFINTYKEDEFINIDFIVAIYRDSYGCYCARTSDGKSYIINDMEEARALFSYLKSQEIEIPDQAEDEVSEDEE